MFKQIIIDIIKKAEKIELEVYDVISDIAGSNQVMENIQYSSIKMFCNTK